MIVIRDGARILFGAREGGVINMAKKTTSSTNKEASTRRRTTTSRSTAAPDISRAQNGHAQETNGRASDEEIRKLAYELYLTRGATAGSEIDDWLRAERQLAAGPEEHAAG
jgi:DUF2934 family protein